MPIESATRGGHQQQHNAQTAEDPWHDPINVWRGHRRRMLRHTARRTGIRHHRHMNLVRITAVAAAVVTWAGCATSTDPRANVSQELT